jgi:preprotein translocase subunit SecB
LLFLEILLKNTENDAIIRCNLNRRDLMSSIVFKGYRAKDIEFHGHLAPGARIALENKYSYNVKYGNGSVCVAELSCQAYDKEAPDQFKVAVILEGIFSFEGDLTREQIHVMTYKELFPYARALVSTITTAAGIPPVILPVANIESQSIYRIDTGNIKP